MNTGSQETLRRVTQNDPSLTNLSLVDNIYDGDDGDFYSDNSDDYSTLGSAIVNNTHLERLDVLSNDDLPLTVADRAFYDGLQSNSSISKLELWCDGQNIVEGVGQEILQVYQENSNISYLGIYSANLQSGGDRVIVDTLSNCRNLQRVTLRHCNITDEQLLSIVDAVRDRPMLEELDLYENNIGNAGCDAIATSLIDPNCNLHTLNLECNAIDNEGATTIANSLTTNNKMKDLYLMGNQIDPSVNDEFSNILCNTTSINNIYSSNHTLETLSVGYRHGQQLASLLKLNNDTNKSHVAIKKILKYHPNIDMESLFEWGFEEDDEERTLKALPYVINWFEKVEEAMADDDEEYGIEERKLSAIFQFAKAMPLLLEGISRIKADKKRKRSE
jgi:Ran GTPase-activating protein (RanGAP) involved in mRNA processing and transport